MQFNVLAVLAAMASVAAAQSTVTVYACTTATAVASTGFVSPTGGSSGVKIPPSPTGSPISYATGAASVNAVSGSALGMIIAGGVALLF